MKRKKKKTSENSVFENLITKRKKKTDKVKKSEILIKNYVINIKMQCLVFLKGGLGVFSGEMVFFAGFINFLNFLSLSSQIIDVISTEPL